MDDENMDGDIELTLFVFYAIIIPIIAIFGFIGNLFSIYIIIRPRRNGGTNKIFSGFMFSYIKALSWSDIAFLVVTFQYCYAIAGHYLLTKDYIDPNSKGLDIYVWIVLTPTWNLFCCVSDLIIVAMTVDRYLVMRKINQIGVNGMKINRKTRGRSFSRKMKNGKLLCKVSKVHIQILFAIFASIIMNMPYYFQYDMVPCHKQIVENDTCKCPKTNYDEDEFHPIPWWEYFHTRKMPIIQNSLLKTQNYSELSNSEVVFWMHCRTKFSFTLVWNVWYIGYEILLKAIPTFLITTLNILMFLKLQNIWKQRREFKKTMQAEAIPIIATPVMNHRTLSIKSKDITSTNCNDDVFESNSSSDKCLSYTTRLKVPSPRIISSNPEGQSQYERNLANISPARSTTSLSAHRESRVTSTSTFSSSSALYAPCQNKSMTTISHLIVQPSLPGEEPRLTKEHLLRVLRYVGLKPKPKKRKILMFNIPSKTTLKELKMTFLLVSLVASHITLTIPINVTLFYWAYYPDAWEAMPDMTRVLVSSMADTLRVVNYSINFYLYCVANDDIRKAAAGIVRNSFVFKKLQAIFNYLCSKIMTKWPYQ